jgi:hypothetical protein
MLKRHAPASRLGRPMPPLSSSHRLMRFFGPIILSEPLLMWAAWPQPPKCRGVGAQLVGDQQFRHDALLPEKLAHQPQRRLAVAAGLHQHVEDLALTIDRTPQVHPDAQELQRDCV